MKFSRNQFVADICFCLVQKKFLRYYKFVTKTSLVKLVNLAEVTQISSALTVDAWVGADNV